jgi:hypothetical protein
MEKRLAVPPCHKQKTRQNASREEKSEKYLLQV